MPRFVILQHDHPTLHWDLMLEASGLLKTWRLPAPPLDEPSRATALGDHRLAYLDYEGPVSGERGTVTRWDTGAYETVEQSNASWTMLLEGRRWRGTVSLRQRQGPDWDVFCSTATG